MAQPGTGSGTGGLARAPGPEELRAAAREWMAGDPDPVTRAELAALLEEDDLGGLAARFAAPLSFGTAGVRGPMGAGPARMNRATVRRVTAGLARYLRARVPGAAARPVVIGFDARRGSDVFAEDAAAVLSGAGLRPVRLPGPLPTPVLAFAVRHLGAVAGMMVTASHNPREDNGCKVYWADGRQIVPPVDSGIAAAIGEVGPARDIPLGPADPPADLPGPADRPGGPEGARGHPQGRPPRPREFRGPHRPGAGILGSYLDAVVPASLHTGHRDIRVAYTPMHGVGLAAFLAAFRRAGFPRPAVVQAQAEPDGAFPTLPRPNPEEPGALDLLMAEGARSGAELLLANDPDADRLGAAIPDGSGGWRMLSGDEIGALLAWHLLGHVPAPGGRLLVTTIVSASLLGRMAASAGACYAETLTGFKWIMRADEQQPGTRFLFGYEEALGYAVTDLVRDKDGITAALALAEAAAEAKSAGRTLADVLDDLARRFGLHATAQWPVALTAGDMSSPPPGGGGPGTGGPGSRGRGAAGPGSSGPGTGDTEGGGPGTSEPGGSGARDSAALLRRLRSAPPASLLGKPVTAVDDLGLAVRSHSDGTTEPLGLPPSEGVIWRCADGTRVAVRPSGTEPKLKVYLQVVLDTGGRGDLAPLRADAASQLEALREEVSEVLEK
ncbi:MAG TPA: phospho-sugar mutase [Streptosporangiaceae bacterium]|nr:phospho-sugar mutase [Streptosporangiaceae bacterium]